MAFHEGLGSVENLRLNATLSPAVECCHARLGGGSRCLWNPVLTVGSWPAPVGDRSPAEVAGRELSTMSITKEKKTQLIQEYRRGENDTGSPEVQIAVYSSRIAELTEHLKGHSKDHAGRRGLLMLVSRRRRLLKYLESSERSRYTEIISRLGLRK